jgi:hypothetical protein
MLLRHPESSEVPTVLFSQLSTKLEIARHFVENKPGKKLTEHNIV